MKAVLTDMKFVTVAVFLAMYTQTLTTGLPLQAMWDSAVAIMLIVALSLLAKTYLPTSLPAFSYATIIGIIVCLPDTPVREFVLDATAKISFLSCCVPLLAFAGLSVGGQLDELKKMSWKVIVLFLVVSTSCFFGASLVAQLGFSLQGVI